MFLQGHHTVYTSTTVIISTTQILYSMALVVKFLINVYHKIPSKGTTRDGTTPPFFFFP